MSVILKTKLYSSSLQRKDLSNKGLYNSMTNIIDGVTNYMSLCVVEITPT